MEPLEFLRAHPPFDRLPAEALHVVEDALEIIYLPKGTRVLERGGAPSRHLHVVRKGAVRLEREGRLVQELEEGEPFGFPSMIGRASPHVDVVAVEDALVYRVPETVFNRLMAVPAFAEFFMLDLSERLRRSTSLDDLPLGRDLGASCTSLSPRPPEFVGPFATVQDAARAMRDAGTSAVLVASDPPGILTDRDLRSRVLAQGRGPQTAVSDVMSRPVRTLPGEATLFEALLTMLEHRIHHVPLERDGTIVGLVSDTDLLRLQLKNPLHLLKRVENLEDLARYGAELGSTVEALAAGGVDAARIGRVVSRLNDALTVRLLRRAEEKLGPPPTSYAWIVFGSEGRMEQALLTDQDNALVYHEPSDEAESYFAALADGVVKGLITASFPECRGGFMATRWRRPLAAWEALFRGWIETPEPRAIMEASNFFDFRRVHGGLDLEPLEAWLRRAGREKLFLAHLAKTALGFSPPLGLFRRIREQEGGVDLKKGGILPIVGLARLYALEAGSDARSTLDRLEAAAAAGTLSRDGASTLGEAFSFLLDLRLKDQLRARAAGEAPGNLARLEALSPLERRHLKDTFLALREIQEAVALRYAVERLS